MATPKAERGWHLSKPLKWLMKKGLDRVRWPVLLTFADTSVGHCGNVYKCSGWQYDGDSLVYIYTKNGKRISAYSNGKTNPKGKISSEGVVRGKATLKRYLHRSCPPGEELDRLLKAGWERVPTGKKWKSGNPAYKWIKNPDLGY